MGIGNKVKQLYARMDDAPQYPTQGAVLVADLARRETRRKYLPLEIMRTFPGGRGNFTSRWPDSYAFLEASAGDYFPAFTKRLGYDQLDPGKLDAAVALACIPESIRGYGPVKERSIVQARAQHQKAMAAFDQARALLTKVA